MEIPFLSSFLLNRTSLSFCVKQKLVLSLSKYVPLNLAFPHKWASYYLKVFVACSNDIRLLCESLESTNLLPRVFIALVNEKLYFR